MDAIYSHWSGISNARIEAAGKTAFTQQVLKGRISVYQFLRSPFDYVFLKILSKLDKIKKFKCFKINIKVGIYINV